MRNVDGDTDVDDPSKLIAYFRVQSCDFIQAIIKFRLTCCSHYCA